MLTVAELKPVLPLPRLRSQRKGGYGIPQTANDTCASYAEFGRRPSPPAVAAKTSRPIFSPLELLVIGIGASDWRTFIKPESRLGRLQQLLFGMRLRCPSPTSVWKRCGGSRSRCGGTAGALTLKPRSLCKPGLHRNKFSICVRADDGTRGAYSGQSLSHRTHAGIARDGTQGNRIRRKADPL